MMIEYFVYSALCLMRADPVLSGLVSSRALFSVPPRAYLFLSNQYLSSYHVHFHFISVGTEAETDRQTDLQHRFSVVKQDSKMCVLPHHGTQSCFKGRGGCGWERLVSRAADTHAEWSVWWFVRWSFHPFAPCAVGLKVRFGKSKTV